MKSKSKLVIFLLVFCFSFSSLSILPVKYSQAVNSESISSDQDWFINKTLDKNFVIEAGATLTVHEGVTLTFAGGDIEVLGKMIVKGTVEKPIKMLRGEEAPYYSIDVSSGGSLVMQNADISGAGQQMLLLWGNPFIKSANATPLRGAINIFGGSLNVRACNFHDNEIAIVINETEAKNILVNRSQFFNNSQYDVIFDSSLDSESVNFKFNWWEKPEGPKKVCEEINAQQHCYWEKISGNVDFSSWLTVRNFRDPVIVIPGVFGSQAEAGIWKIDPVFHVYDNLLDSLEMNGYTTGKDLFIFPYDWRKSNVENAVRLKYKIAEIKTIANWPKVDLVAHSMGGLLARQYIESNDYQDDIDQLITLGTPNKGAPEIYPLWEAGKSIGVVQTGMKKFLEQEMREAGYSEMFDYIREKPIYPAKELLPTYEYLYDLENKRPLSYPSEYPFNEFLASLNSEAKLQKLTKVEYVKIVGNVSSDSSTISSFEVMRPDLGELWKHGYPLGFEIPVVGDRGSIRGRGDGTVPIASAESIEIPANNYIELDSSHIDLPTKGQKNVLEELTGRNPAWIIDDSLIKNMLQFFVHSPIDIQIISPSGERVGKDFETGGSFNEIEGAFYSGYETENEFVTIPNPEEGEYRILTQGTGNGAFEVEVVNLSPDPAKENEVLESVATVSGTAETNKPQQLAVQLTGELVTDKNKPADQPAEQPTPTPDPVVTPPVTPPVVITENPNPTSQVTQPTAKHKTSKKKKAKKKKKTKKPAVKKVTVQKKKVAKVAGISKAKAVKQKSAVTKTLNNFTKKATTLWNNATTKLKNLLQSPFKYFRR